MINFHRYPKVVSLIDSCLDEADSDLIPEALYASEHKNFLPWPEKINNGGWKTLGGRWQGKDIEDFRTESLRMIVRWHSDIILNAGYSLMEPGARIKPHTGYTKDVLRLHIGLVCPEGDCQIRIGDAHYKWTVYGAMLFDDTIEHEAWNNTDEDRIILLLDLKKDCL